MSDPSSAGKVGRCPICGRPTDPGYRPFCTRRCADVDLSRWLGGVYAIPVTGPDDDEDGDDTMPGRDLPPNGRHDN